MSRKVIVIVVSVIVIVAAVFAAVAWFVPVLKVANVQVTGATRTDPDQVVEVSGIREGDNLLRINATDAALAVVDLPWVGSVTVNRKLPDTVEVKLTEREAVVFVNRPDGDHVIDTEGLPIIIGAPPFGTIGITGTQEEDPDVLPDVIAVVNAIDAYDSELKGQIESIHAPDRFDILLKLNDGREIYWGSAENNHDKAVAMSTVIKREGQHWNVSSPSMVTVR